MSNLDTAKALLKKGIALGDQELIDMANSMLEGTDTVSELWFCEKCNDTFDNTKGRKSCPKCKGRKISICAPLALQVDINPPVHKDDISNFQMQKKVMTDDKGRKLRFNAAGQVEGTYGRPAPIQVGNTVKATDLSKIKEDIEIDSKIKYSDNPVPSRPPIKMGKIKCQSCGDESMVPAHHIGIYYSKSYYLCNKCGSKGR